MEETIFNHMQNKKVEELHVLIRKVWFETLRSEFDQILYNKNQRRQIIVAMIVDDF